MYKQSSVPSREICSYAAKGHLEMPVVAGAGLSDEGGTCSQLGLALGRYICSERKTEQFPFLTSLRR